MSVSYADIINKRKREWGKDIMDAAKRPRGEKIPFSSPLLNYSTYGGIPRNQITEFFGDPGGGKSSTAIDICKNAHNVFEIEYRDSYERLQSKAASGDKQAKSDLVDLEDAGPKKIIYFDLEHAFDGSWARTLGINTEEIDIIQPPDVFAEDILQTVIELVETGEVGLIVLDSIPSLTTKSELEKKLGERTVASLAGLLTVFFRKVVPMLTRYNTTMLIINQTRDNLDNPYVVQTPGGKALKFYCSLRMQFRIGAPVDFLGNELPQSTENPAGYIVTAKIVKQKSAPWDRKNGSYYLMAHSGIRLDIDFAQLAVKKYDIIHKQAAWFTITDPFTGEVLEDEDGKPVKINGMAKVIEYINDNLEYFDKLKKFILDDISNGSVSLEDKDGEQT